MNNTEIFSEAEATGDHVSGLLFSHSAIAKFARWAAHQEREACAKVCEEYDDDRGTGETWGPRFAAMIRARSEK